MMSNLGKDIESEENNLVLAAVGTLGLLTIGSILATSTLLFLKFFSEIF